MKLVFRPPYQRELWIAPVSLELAQKTIAKQFAFGRGNPAPFRGRLLGNKFRGSRVASYRNFFVPVLRGELREVANNRTQVELVMRPPLPTLIFMSVWTLGILAVLGRAALMGTEGAGSGFWMVFPTFAFGVVLMGFSFGSEATEALRKLKQALGEEPA